MVKNTKTWISWKWNIIFLWNKKILNLCLRWNILRSYCFLVEVTFNLYMSNPGSKRKHYIKKLSEIRYKAIYIIKFKDKNYETNELYHNNKILKIAGYIKLLNFLFIKSILLHNYFPIPENLFKKASKLAISTTPNRSIWKIFHNILNCFHME